MRELIFGVVGGLALFIYGMHLMSEGLKKVAGERLRKILGRSRETLIGGGWGRCYYGYSEQ